MTSPSPRTLPHPGWLAFAALLLALPAGALLLQKRAPDFPVYGTLPAFSLLDQQGRPFARSDLEGRPAVVNFVFTRCAAICPALTRKMRSLQQQLAEAGRGAEVRLVSITADPENDTPEALADYAARYGADTRSWSFVTGALDDVQRTIVDGFKISVAKVPRPAGAEEPTDFEIVHGQKFVLLDAAGQIRGYYDV
ncbi:MAG: SCO family protein, partial [Myxococcales bacterium]